MVRVVGVRFKKAGKVYYFDPAEFPIAAGQKVVVETARGVEYGEVAVGLKDVPEDQVIQPLKKVLRIGNEKDAVVAAENKRKENEAFGVAQKKIEGHNLDMNLVDVEYTFDGSKIIFYFTAEGRIDFRELVRDLAGVFRTRIEMRQIGVRDEAKLLGGIGPCGRILCCTSFLGDFAPVSIRMAKDQNLSLNPSKISGLCGRLMCCLRYEQETYEAAKKDPTLAPGYVPPVLIEENAPINAEEFEDRPVPAIGVLRRESGGMSARIAQAAGITAERPRREERPQPTERRAPQERPQGAPRPQQVSPKQSQSEAPAARPQPQQRPQQGQAQGGGERRREQQPQQSRQQQGRPNRPQQQAGGEKAQQNQQPRQQQPREQQPRGERQQHPPRDRQQQPRQQQPRPQGEAQQAQGQRPQQGTGEEQQRRHHRGHRRRGGGNPQGGASPQGGGNSPT